MRGKKQQSILWYALDYLRAFLLFFATVSTVVTATFLVFFSAVSLSEEEIRIFAPAVFANVLVLATACVVIDALRRYFTLKRPARKIQAVLQQLTNGDFSARISESDVMDRYNNFGEIAEHINALAGELAGVETLRTDFIANVSHELKTPLAVIQNYGTMLQSPELSDEKRIEYAKAITGQSRRLADLITNILKLNRLENQQIYPTAKRYNLGEQLAECLLNFENTWEKKNIDIETDIEEDIFVKSDDELLSLVWNNLFSNALKFTEAGGTVSVTLKTKGDFAAVKVSDTGCGISQETGKHIFEKFYQGDTSHATQGNGLGLALVKRVVDIVGGEISVESEVGKGSVFTVKIRRAADGDIQKNP